MGATAATADTYECADSELIGRIGEDLATLAPEERELVVTELFPAIVRDIYGTGDRSHRGPQNNLLDMLRSFSEALNDFRAIRYVEKATLGAEFQKKSGPLGASYVRTRSERERQQALVR